MDIVVLHAAATTAVSLTWTRRKLGLLTIGYKPLAPLLVRFASARTHTVGRTPQFVGSYGRTPLTVYTTGSATALHCTARFTALCGTSTPLFIYSAHYYYLSLPFPIAGYTARGLLDSCGTLLCTILPCTLGLAVAGLPPVLMRIHATGGSTSCHAPALFTSALLPSSLLRTRLLRLRILLVLLAHTVLYAHDTSPDSHATWFWDTHSLRVPHTLRFADLLVAAMVHFGFYGSHTAFH